MQYRIEELDGQYEPQMLYSTGITGEEKWFPLNKDGYWDDPNSYSMGLIRRRSLMSEAEAAKALVLARAINT